MVSPVKLCIVSSSACIGGQEMLLHDLCLRLDPRRFALTICLLSPRGRFVDLMVGDLGSRVHVFDLTSGRGPRGLGDLTRLLHRTRPHVIHAFGFRGDVISRGLRLFVGNPALASVVANPALPHAAWRRRLNRLTAWCVDAYWADCHTRAALGRRHLAIPGSKIRVIYPGIPEHDHAPRDADDDGVREELGLRPADPLILSLGDLRLIKGHQYIVEAAPIILRRFPEAMFVFIGADRTGGALSGLAERLGLGRHVRFLGFHGDPRRYLRASDVVLQPSLSEGLPRAVLETLSLGKPLVASAVGGIPEVITHGVNGYLIPPHDGNALAEGVILLLSDPSLRAALARRGRATVDEAFGRTRMVAAFAALYAELSGRMLLLRGSVVHGRGAVDA
jgi:glycosyltransferase involved in cell wall biosynthesis